MIKTDILDSINATLEDWLDEHLDLDLTCRVDTDFYHYHNDEDDECGIAWSLFQNEAEEQRFKIFIKEELAVDVDRCHPWLLSFFHEVGHEMTMDDFSDAELEQDRNQRNAIEASEDPDYFAYFNLPLEKAATKWAVDFIIHNQDLVTDLLLDVMEQLALFYEVNNIAYEED